MRNMAQDYHRAGGEMARPEFTIGELADRFLDHLLEARDCSPLTIKAYRGDIEQFRKFLANRGHPETVSQIDSPVIYEFDDELRGIKPATRRRKMHALSSFFKYAIRRGYASTNPVAGLELPKRKHRLHTYLTADEISRLLQAVVTPIERAILTTLIYTGTRKAELIGIDQGDIDWDHGVLRVRGKGGKERAINLHPQCSEAILDYLKFRRETNSPALFLNSVGKRLCPTFVQNLFQRCLRRAGLRAKGYTIHTLRHTFATMLCQSGVDLCTVRDIMGHADISTTAIYAHSSSQLRRDAVEGLPRF